MASARDERRRREGHNLSTEERNNGTMRVVFLLDGTMTKRSLMKYARVIGSDIKEDLVKPYVLTKTTGNFSIYVTYVGGDGSEDQWLQQFCKRIHEGLRPVSVRFFASYYALGDEKGVIKEVLFCPLRFGGHFPATDFLQDESCCWQICMVAGGKPVQDILAKLEDNRNMVIVWFKDRNKATWLQDRFSYDRWLGDSLYDPGVPDFLSVQLNLLLNGWMERKEERKGRGELYRPPHLRRRGNERRSTSSSSPPDAAVTLSEFQKKLSLFSE